MYYVYMIRCKDNSIYTGITKDVKRRWEEHKTRDEKCAKYTKNHPVEKIEAVWETETKALASKLEYHIKTLKKVEKEKLIKDKDIAFYLGDIISANDYKIDLDYLL